jgi:hypothetical protein
MTAWKLSRAWQGLKPNSLQSSTARLKVVPLIEDTASKVG